VTFKAEAGTYCPTLQEDAGEGSANNSSGEQWQRQALTINPEVIDVTQPGEHTRMIASGLELFVRVRTDELSGIASVTASLRNRTQPTKGKDARRLRVFSGRASR
jgi:hypothetical protein